jgi:hypothetical protein
MGKKSYWDNTINMRYWGILGMPPIVPVRKKRKKGKRVTGMILLIRDIGEYSKCPHSYR